MKAVNLLPPDLRGTPTASAPVVAADVERSAGPIIVLGALALLVAAVAGYVLAGNTIKQREADLAAATTREQAITAQAAKLKPYADFDALASARIATVRDLAGQRFDWEQALRDLSRAIPADVTLSELNGTVSPSGGTAGGGGSSGLRGAISAPAIEIKGCTDTQRDVATLMARLKNIDGVTRVSLAKSEKSTSSTTDAAAAASDSAGASGEGDGCGEGNPPAFEMVMFFEGQAAATAAADAGKDSSATAAPAATATPAAGATASATPTPAAGSTTSTPASTQGGVTP